MMETSFYNTVQATHPELGRYENKAQSQETKILDYFKTYEAQISPSKLQSILFHDRTPITSIRRGLTNLTNKGELVKTEFQVRGNYGRKEHVWRLADKYRQMRLL